MKRALPLFSLLLCSLVGSAAWAQVGINLAWNDCPSGATATFSLPSGCNDDASVHRLVASFVPPPGITQLVGQESAIHLQATTATLPDWWRLAVGECRYGSLGALFTFPGLSACANFWGTSAVGAHNYESGFMAPNRARLRVISAVPPSAGGPVSEDTEYYTFRVTISMDHTTPADPPVCGGCETPVCIVLTDTKLTQPFGYGDYVLTTPLTSQVVSWQCASLGTHIGCMAYGCPTSTTHSTWGQVKSLYR